MKKMFTFGNMDISVRLAHLTPKIEEAFLSGRYENAERGAIRLHATRDDRILDLGGGIGCTGVVAGKIVGGDNLMIVEANAELMPEIEENLTINGIFGAELVHGAVVAKKTSETIGFHQPKAFWAGSLVAKNTRNTPQTEVPAVAFSELVATFDPTIIVCDIEGGEAEIFQDTLPDHVRLIILELHPKQYDQETIKMIFDRLSEMGFSYLPHGSRGAVVCLVRKKRPSS